MGIKSERRLFERTLVIQGKHAEIHEDLMSSGLFANNHDVAEMAMMVGLLYEMTDKRDENGELLPDEERLTKFGKMLRSTSLDELPELWNIFKGDMSLIGPRPLLVQYLPLYNEAQKRRHEVRPGITGYAQVNGRNSISWEARFEMDVYYVDNVSFLMDCKILFKTVLTVLKKDGIHSATSATMEPFQGSKHIE